MGSVQRHEISHATHDNRGEAQTGCTIQGRGTGQSLQQVFQELEETGRVRFKVKLGDASMAAPFTSRARALKPRLTSFDKAVVRSFPPFKCSKF